MELLWGCFKIKEKQDFCPGIVSAFEFEAESLLLRGNGRDRRLPSLQCSQCYDASADCVSGRIYLIVIAFGWEPRVRFKC